MEDTKAFICRKDYSVSITSYIKNCLSFPFGNVPKSIVEELRKIQKNFLRNFTAPKIKHSTTRIDYQYGWLKNVDVSPKIISLQCSCFRQLTHYSL